MNCNNTNIPDLIAEECNGVYTSTNCVTDPNAITYLNLPANSTATTIINALVLNAQYKDEIVSTLTTQIENLTALVPAYTAYTALLTQTSTNAPVATVISNNTGQTITWSYVSNGTYLATFSGTIVQDKLWFSATNSATLEAVISLKYTSSTTMTVKITSSQTPLNDRLNKTPIEIRIYN